MKKLKKIIVILGPTASGKTALSLAIAKKFNGEIVNADSRQIYKNMNIGTEKPEGAWTKINSRSVYMVKNIPHHLVDFVEPNHNFSLAEYKKMAIEAIEDIISRGKLPILVGGTGLYISSVIDNLDIPKVAPSSAMRAEFEKQSLEELVRHLKQIDPEAAEKIDIKNPRRVIRALEVAIVTGQSFVSKRKKPKRLYDALELGILSPKDELYKKIDKRTEEQIKRGFVQEVKILLNKYGEGFWIFPSMSSIGYKEVANFLAGKISDEEAKELIKRKTRSYAKKQMTWFKRDKKIMWIKDLEEAEKIINDFLK